MQEGKLTLEVSAHDVASCNICCAHNYDSSTQNAVVGERVDKLYELKIGKQVITLCDKCLDRLRDMLAQRANTKGAE